MYNLWLFIDGNGAKLPTDTGVKNHQLCCRHKKKTLTRLQGKITRKSKNTLEVNKKQAT